MERMSFGSSAVKRARAFTRRVATTMPLSKPESITLVVLVGVAVCITLVLIVVTPEPDLGSTLFQLAITLAFLLFIRWPWAAVLSFILALALTFALDLDATAFIPVALAAGLVVRVGNIPLIATYTAAVLLSTARMAMDFSTEAGSERIAAYPLLAALSAAVGLTLRLAFTREQRLGIELAKRAEAEENARRAERQRIADDLHDVIAHDLTVIAMHARVLERAAGRDDADESLTAIGDAARKALSDLRRVVQQNEVVELQGLAGGSDLVGAFDAAQRELRVLDVPVDISGDPDDGRLPRLVSSTLARILRESVTNILKHGGTGPVRIQLMVDDSTARMEVRNALSTAARPREADSGGYGTVRMAERATRMGGTYVAERRGGEWVVAVRLPIA